jgi:DNA polymerase
LSLYTIDFETYYDKDYSLSKLTTEEYVRDPRFEIILCGFQRDDADAYWIPGERVVSHIKELELEGHAVLAHHAHFDGLILAHHCDTRPRIWFDTLSMARARHGARGGNSLAKLAERYGVGRKGDEVMLAIGKHRRDFTSGELARYGGYCCNDVRLERQLFDLMLPYFVKSELKLIDATIRLFTEPVLELDVPLLEQYAAEQQLAKQTALLKAGCQLQDVMSNERFAEVLRFFGVEPPMKISPTTGKRTYAFAKTDEGMQALVEHDDENVQLVAAARLQNKTTINETRARRMVSMASRGRACVYINYYGAGQTGRASGGDKMNWQNFTRGGTLRKAVRAPDGHELVVGDSSNIESRMEDWLAGQEDAVEAYRRYDRGEGPDIYCVVAERIYGRTITKKDNPEERQMGKVTKLGLGYGMGPPKFVFAVKAQVKKDIALSEAENIVRVYRSTHAQVVNFWKRCDEALWRVYRKQHDVAVDYRGVIRTCPGGLMLPNRMVIRYPDLEYTDGEGFSYFNGKSREKIYGGKVCENIIQALARIVVMSQTMMVRHKLVMSVHDEGVWCVPTGKVKQVVREVETAFRTPLDWCPDLPLNCEVKSNRVYGLAK